MNHKKAEWVLRIAVAGEFLGHGVFALLGKPQWGGWVSELTGATPELAAQLIILVGLLDIIVAIFVLVKPIRLILLWAAFWGFWTALVRPLVGEPIWDFVERWANWGAPLALLLLQGWPRGLRGWWRVRG
ncbi:MAG: hypothetical protein COV10_04430 [Candidatus Vogelbacteria bacterium CG10_big_fil_rev_8_21_14_0_10_51_16]|uniref:DoxX family protein n=1 Tax=Candidatus Vogelbacteria bacterium CG10_big_fil_rev_8_21_14_0_10_51_16 TaxID=1975045 RepID=A0A2H0RD47_9BACT|nr:MAG: hypothetical protein COV10_04430 [Candidatus Vogelbacteria bacterium CG10_big_fil_rev_8_21_14_0_10_51_16]